MEHRVDLTLSLCGCWAPGGRHWLGPRMLGAFVLAPACGVGHAKGVVPRGQRDEFACLHGGAGVAGRDGMLLLTQQPEAALISEGSLPKSKSVIRRSIHAVVGYPEDGDY